MATIKYLGESFTMSEKAIAAAYRHRQMEHWQEDAIRHINEYVLGGVYITKEAHEKAFERTCGVPYDYVIENITLFVSYFEEIYDCNRSENEMWLETVRRVLDALRCKICLEILRPILVDLKKA